MISKVAAEAILQKKMGPMVRQLEMSIDKAIDAHYRGNGSTFDFNIGELPEEVIDEIIKMYLREGWEVMRVNHYTEFTWTTLRFR